MVAVLCRVKVKKSADFFENRRNSVGPVGSILKITDFWNLNSEISKKITKSEKLCKKIRWNSKNIGGEKNFKSWSFCWIKFKLNQKHKNEPTWPSTHVYGIRSPQLGWIVDSSFPIRSGWERSRRWSGRERIVGDTAKIDWNRAVIGRGSR
jgi:hypothetical protein